MNLIQKLDQQNSTIRPLTPKFDGVEQQSAKTNGRTTLLSVCGCCVVFVVRDIFVKFLENSVIIYHPRIICLLQILNIFGCINSFQIS